jgi:RHS repeat-associated protein
MLATAVILPDEREYRFRYNKYIELWRVELPTGGAIEYEHGSGTANPQGVMGNGDLNAGGEMGIFRRVTERRVYADGATLEGKTVYTATGSTVTADHRDAAGNSLGKNEHLFTGDPIPSLTMLPTQYNFWRHGKEDTTKLYDKLNGPQLRQVDNVWDQQQPAWWTAVFGPEPPNNPVLTDVITRLKDISPNLVSKEHYAYDQFFNRTLVEEYDFGSGSVGVLQRYTTAQFLSVSSYTNPTASTSNKAYLRSLPVQQSVYDANGAEKSRTSYEYDNYIADPEEFHSPLVDRPDIIGIASGFTTSFEKRGNVTKLSRRVLSTSTELSAYQQYDLAGNVVLAIDPKNKRTTLDFSDRFGTPDGSARNNIQNPQELGALATYAFASSTTNALSHTTYTQRDYYTGNPVDGEDPNQTVASAFYNDLLDRPTQVIRGANNTALKTQTSFAYNDASHVITTTIDQTAYGDNRLKSQIVYDGLGRTIETRQYETATAYIVTVQKYDALGRPSQVSNPYRSLSESELLTTTAYDGLGRAVSLTTPDGAVAQTAYHGARMLVTDQAGKQRIGKTNGLGQLTEVWDVCPPDAATEAVTFPGFPGVTNGYLTTYAYDVLDNLTTVTQRVGTSGTTQTRSFTYDSLRRLTQAQNPETGTINYTYDANSNLETKQDARVTTNYEYDAVNRVISRTYLPATEDDPPVFYRYDNQQLPAGAPSGFVRGSSAGRLVSVTYGSTSASDGTYTGYDELGRVISSFQQTDGNNYKLTYAYNRSGALISQTYPGSTGAGNGRVVVTEYDDAGRIAGIKKDASSYYAGGAPGDSVNRIGYASHGAVATMKLGNGRWEHTSFNSRLQPIQIGLGTSATDSSVLKLDYEYGTTLNNGNVLSQQIVISGSAPMDVKQNYAYDALNRLATATEIKTSNSVQQWHQTYSYDRYGNRWVSASSGYTLDPLTPQSQSAIDATKNRLVTSGYDGAGNQTGDSQGSTFGYNAENRQIRLNTTTGRQYFYDGDGHRVKKIDATGTSVFVYNAAGQLIAEYVTGTPAAGGTSYLTTDHLGSTRLVSGAPDGAGVVPVRARYDYLPFGEELGAGIGLRTVAMGYSGADATRQKFTQYGRDVECHLDFANSRYYSSPQGRFTSVDPSMSVNPVVTQSWNLYVYVVNNPLRFVDPSGLIWLTSGGDDPTYKWVNDQEYYQNQEAWAGWTPVETGSVIYLGWVGEDFEDYGHLVGTFVTLDEGGELTPVQDPEDEPTVRLRSQPGMDVQDVSLILETYRRSVDRMTKEGRRTWWFWNAISTDLNWMGICEFREYLSCGEQATRLFVPLSANKYKSNWVFRPSNVSKDGTVSWSLHVWIEASSDNPANPTLVLDPWYDKVQINFPKNRPTWTQWIK